MRIFNSIYFYLALSTIFHSVVLFGPGLFKFKIKNNFSNNSPIVLTRVILEKADKISNKTDIHRCIDKVGLYNTKESLISYKELLRSIIYKNLKYPEIARINKIEGEAIVNFSINHYGKLLDYKIIKSTGYGILDREIEEAFRKIKAFPQFPDFIKKEILNFSLTIIFKIDAIKHNECKSKKISARYLNFWGGVIF